MVIFIVPKYTADFKAERAPTTPEIPDREVTKVRGPQMVVKGSI